MGVLREARSLLLLPQLLRRPIRAAGDARVLGVPGREGPGSHPYRAGYLQLVVVSETDERAQTDDAEHIEYFYRKCLHIPPHYFGSPGYQDYRSLEKGIRSGVTGKITEQLLNLKQYSYKDFAENQFVIAGSPATVRDKLREAAKDLRTGNLMVLLHIGSMPHHLTIKNIDLFTNEVYPYIRDLWDDEGWENRW